MSISLDSILGIHEHAVNLRSRRAEILAANLSNADTPNYKSRDIDFAQALAAAVDSTKGTKVATTNDRHISASEQGSYRAPVLKYRTPFQPALDGNTVDTAIEQAKFLDNAMRYQASLNFLNGRVRSLLAAIRGE